MPSNNNTATVEGRIGDISGRLGDISGRLGDISGRLGDISGRASSADVQDSLLEDREADKVRFIEARIARIESEILLVVRWVNAQMQLGKSDTTSADVSADVLNVKEQATRTQNRVENLETAVAGIMQRLGPASPSQPQPPA